MQPAVRLDLVEEESLGPPASAGTAALRLAPSIDVILRFAIVATHPLGVEALRHARRAMLREELTLGRPPDAPSLDAAVFSSSEVSWSVPIAHRFRCLERLAELERRANRTLAELARR
jgi:hypothetical protein